MPDYTAVGATELANHIPALVVESAQDGLGHLRSYLNLARTVNRNYEQGDFRTKGKSITVPKRGALTANDKTAKSNVTKQAPDDDGITLTLNKHKEVTFLMEDVASVQAVRGSIGGYIQDAVAVIAEQVESDLAALYASAGNTISYSTFSSWPTAISRARRILVTNKVPRTQTVYGQFDEYAVEAMVNEDKIADASKFGSREGVVEGALTKVRGVNLFESQIVGIDTSTSPDTYHNLVYTRDAMMLAVRPLPAIGSGMGTQQATIEDPESGLAIRSSMSYDKDALGLQVTLDILYGVKTLRSEHMVAISHQPSVDS